MTKISKPPFVEFVKQRRKSVFPFTGDERIVDGAVDLASRGLYIEAAEYYSLFKYAYTSDHNLFVGLGAWSGEPIPDGGALYVHDEAGWGDCFQFYRYLPLIRKRLGPGVKIYYFTRENCYDLFWDFACASDVELLIRRPFDRAYAQPAQVAMPVFHLPFLFGAYTPPAPYLHALPEHQASLARKFTVAGSPRIGICWTAGENREFNSGKKNTTIPLAERRSVPARAVRTFAENLRDLFPLMNLYSFVLGQDKEVAYIPDVVDMSRILDVHNWSETAAALQQMDLFITADTGIAHLAGALHVPTILLLPSLADWRWGGDYTGETTHWYPTMRIAQQPSAGDWRGAFDKALPLVRAILERN